MNLEVQGQLGQHSKPGSGRLFSDSGLILYAVTRGQTRMKIKDDLFVYTIYIMSITMKIL